MLAGPFRVALLGITLTLACPGRNLAAQDQVLTDPEAGFTLRVPPTWTRETDEDGNWSIERGTLFVTVEFDLGYRGAANATATKRYAHTIAPFAPVDAPPTRWAPLTLAAPAGASAAAATFYAKGDGQVLRGAVAAFLRSGIAVRMTLWSFPASFNAHLALFRTALQSVTISAPAPVSSASLSLQTPADHKGTPPLPTEWSRGLEDDETSWTVSSRQGSIAIHVIDGPEFVPSDAKMAVRSALLPEPGVKLSIASEGPTRYRGYPGYTATYTSATGGLQRTGSVHCWILPNRLLRLDTTAAAKHAAFMEALLERVRSAWELAETPNPAPSEPAPEHARREATSAEVSLEAPGDWKAIAAPGPGLFLSGGLGRLFAVQAPAPPGKGNVPPHESLIQELMKGVQSGGGGKVKIVARTPHQVGGLPPGTIFVISAVRADGLAAKGWVFLCPRSEGHLMVGLMVPEPFFEAFRPVARHLMDSLQPLSSGAPRRTTSTPRNGSVETVARTERRLG